MKAQVKKSNTQRMVVLLNLPILQCLHLMITYKKEQGTGHVKVFLK